MKNRVYPKIRMLIITSFILIAILSATVSQDTSNQANLFPNITGNAKIDSLNKYILDIRGSDIDMRMSIGRKCYELSKRENYKLGEIQSLYNIGASFFHLLEPDSALVYYKLAYGVAKKNDNVLWKMNLATNLGQIFSNKYQFDSASTYYNIGIKNAQIIKDTSAIGYLFNLIGISYWKRDDFNKAIENYKFGLNINRIFRNYKRVVQSLNGLGSSYYNLKNNILALEYYFEALETEKKYRKINSSIILNNIGLLYLDLNDTTLAEKYFQEGLKNAEVKTSTLGKGYSFLNLADLYFKKQKYSEALEYYYKAILFYKKLKDKNGISKIFNKIGLVYLKTNQLELAEKNFLEAYEISKINGLKLIQTKSLINFCKIQILQGKYGKVGVSLDKASKFASDGNFTDSKLEIFELQTEVSEKLKEFEISLKYHYKFHHLKDSLFNENSLRILADTKEKYEVNKKEKENNHLRHVNHIQRLELENQTKEKVFIAIASVILFFVIVYLIYQNTQRKKQNVALVMAKNEVEEINLRLNETNKLLEQSNSTKDKFFSIISHDLRNPFNTLLGASQILNLDDGEMSEDEKRELIKIISNDSNKLYVLLENLLFWSRSQTGNLQAKKVNIFLHNSVAEIIALYKSSADNKNIKVEIEISEQYLINFDQFMFSTIIRNLLSNAIKFSHKNGKISFVSSEKNDKIYLLVIDEGVGIKEENLKKLFSENSDYKTLGTDNEKGTGLGLILCRDFANENNSTINVKSEIGKGTTFELILEKGN